MLRGKTRLLSFRTLCIVVWCLASVLLDVIIDINETGVMTWVVWWPEKIFLSSFCVVWKVAGWCSDEENIGRAMIEDRWRRFPAVMEATRNCCGGGDECTSSWHHWHAGDHRHQQKFIFLLDVSRLSFRARRKLAHDSHPPTNTKSHRLTHEVEQACPSSYCHSTYRPISPLQTTHQLKMTWYINCHKWVTFHLSTTCAHQPTHLLQFRTLSCASLSSIASATVVALFLIFTIRTMKLSIALLSLTAGASAFTAAPLQTRWVFELVCGGNFSWWILEWMWLMRHRLLVGWSKIWWMAWIWGEIINCTSWKIILERL